MSRRLLAGYLSLALVVLVVLEVPLAVAYRRNERADLESKVERDAVAVGSLSEDVLEAGSRQRAPLARLASRYREDTGGRIVIVTRSGISVVDGGGAAGRDLSSRPEIASALAGDVASGTRYSNTLGHGLLYVAVPVASGGVVHGAVRITYPTSELDHRVYRYWATLAAIGAVVLVLTAAAGIVVARWVSRPLLELERTARRAGEGDLTVRADETSGPPEVRSLAGEVNVMVREVEELLQAQRSFVADASHQLRTPLTALRLRLESLQRDVVGEGGPELEAALAEVERLGHIVDGLLVLARAEALGPPPASLDLAPLIRGRVEAWTALADERGVALHSSVRGDARVFATQDRLEQALDNLLANALEASPSGSVVRLDWRQGELHVLDEGKGMTEDELAHAFDRFWSAGSGDGSGLGLAIVRRLVEADGGTVELERRTGGGLDAVLRLRRPESSSTSYNV